MILFTWCGLRPPAPQMMKMMRLLIILLTAGALHVSATGRSQTITYAAKNETLEKVFKAIGKQSGYRFFYDYNLVKDEKPVTVMLSNVRIEEAMKSCLQFTSLDYSIQDKTVVIVKRVVSTTPVTIPVPVASPPVDVHGRLMDQDGEPVMGASVKIKGTDIGTTTNANGEFILKNVEEKAILVFTATNIETFEQKIKGKAELGMLVAQRKVDDLNEVVVNKGYYTEKQRLSVGSTSRVSGDDIRKQPVIDPLLALQGRVPGLSISQASGVPGAYSVVQLRGQNFLMGSGRPVTANDPLYVIDGVPFGSESLTSPYIGGGALRDIKNTNYQFDETRYQSRSGISPFSVLSLADIESIEVLKDADATAIYGARGANGVILITTRKGRQGPVRLNVNVSSGVSRITRKLPMLNTQQYLEMRREAYRNDGWGTDFTFPYGDYDVNGTWDTTRYTNWQEELVDRPTAFSNASISVSGGNNNTQYIIGSSYNRQGVSLPGNLSTRGISVFSTVSSTSTDQRFRIGLTASFNNQNSNIPGSVEPITSLTFAPDAPALYDAHGKLNWQDLGGGATFTNPLRTINAWAQSVTDNLISNLSLGYRILPGLEISVNAGYTFSRMRQLNINPSTYFNPPTVLSSDRSASYANTDSKVWLVEPQLSYHKVFGQSTIDLMAGATFQDKHNNTDAQTASDFSSDALLSNPAAAVNYRLSGYAINQSRFNSIYGRAGYNWKEKYIVNLTARRDGSSRFGPGRQFGNFGSAGIGWVFSKESIVMNSLPWLSFGKLRASYGSVGSDAIGDYQFIRTYSLTPGARYQSTVPVTPNGHANPYFQWQTDRKLDIGLELGLLADRVNFAAGYYQNRTPNQLVGYPMPIYTGFTSVVENLPAVVQNTGWEFSLNTVNIKTREWRWTSNIIFFFNRNKLVSFPGIENTSYKNSYVVGKPVSSRLVYHYLGVDPSTGVYTFASKDGTGIPQEGVDQIWSDPFTPRWEGSWQNSLSYKGFALDIFFQFVRRQGTSIQAGLGRPGDFNINQPITVLQRWQKPGDITNVQLFTQGYNPKADVAQGNFVNSDGAITDASFVRLKNVSISYNLPPSWLKSVRLQNARLYLQCQNLLTITGYFGLDPETGGINLPPMRTVTAGVGIGL